MEKKKRNKWLKLLASSGLVGVIVTMLVTGITGNPVTGTVAGKAAEAVSDQAIEQVTAEDGHTNR